MMRTCLIAALLATIAGIVSAQTVARDFTIYFIDVEGGQSVLYVAPSGETLLMDTGFPGGRDADRIMEAVKDAGAKQIDYLASSHYDVDHIGSLKLLSERIPVKTYVDHGAQVGQEQYWGFQEFYKAIYSKVNHHVAKPGDKIPLKGVDVLVVTAAKQALKTPAAGGGKPNPACAAFKPIEERDDENGQSLGLLFSYGKFRTINLGDLTWNREFDLMCPNNLIGGVDLYMTSQHGTDRSGSAALVHGLHPQVAIVNNGPHKGAIPSAMTILRTSPALEDIWQLHWGEYAGLEYNSPGLFIANMDDPAAAAELIQHPLPPQVPRPANAPPQGDYYPRTAVATGHTPAYWIKVAAHPDGSYTVTNPRNHFSKTYQGGRWKE